MITKERMREKFKEQLSYERQAYDLYCEYVEKLSDEELVRAFSSIRDDEVKHAAIVKKFIDLC
jgi:rubrerythrin